jgi:Ca2+-binding EF-hand superfamily protein
MFIIKNLGEKLNDEEIEGLLDDADMDSEGTIRSAVSFGLVCGQLRI